MRASKQELPVTAQTGDYTGTWAELGDMHYAFETCAAGYDMDALVKIFPITRARPSTGASSSGGRCESNTPTATRKP